MNRSTKLQTPSSREAPNPKLQSGWRRLLPFALAALGSALLVVSLRLPLWQMRLEAPQYRDQEALHIAVHPNALRGDLKEINTLDQYIGVHVPPVLPQFKWLPALLSAGAGLGLLAGLLGARRRSRALPVVTCALAAALAFAALQAMGQIRDIGHKRDQRTILAGVKDFTPPFLGTNKIAQFTVSSRFGLGAWLIGGALALQLSAAWLSRRASLEQKQTKGTKAEKQLDSCHTPAQGRSFSDDHGIPASARSSRSLKWLCFLRCLLWESKS